jgi:hypothetical protein
MEELQAAQLLESGEVLESRIRELDALRAQVFELGEAGEQGECVVGERFGVADGEVLDRLELAEEAIIRLGEGGAFHLHLGDDAVLLRDLRTELFQGGDVGRVGSRGGEEDREDENVAKRHGDD